MYIERTLEQTLKKASEAFPVILITGPRQVGKTTLLERCAQGQRHYVTLDDLDERQLAQTDPQLFLKSHPFPLIIDEIQYAPQLLSAIKMVCDRERKPGLFWLTGSQKFHLMRGIQESLAGRVAILDLLGLAQAELANYAHDVIPFLPTRQWIQSAAQRAPKTLSLMATYERIWMGSFPQVLLNKKTDRSLFYRSYVQTYIQRDVKDITSIKSEEGFFTFLKAVAARTGQLLNYADLARDTNVSHRTVKAWLEVLEASGIIYLLRPFHSNVTNRLIKTPKVYFLDTGLCCFLTRWDSPESLEAGAMSGSILETYLFCEILKSYWHNGKEPYFYFYRDKDQKEIDLLIEHDNVLYPVEFKKTASPGSNALKNFHALAGVKKQIGHGGVICLRDTHIPISQDVDVIPLAFL